jgi:hypothetical protein
MLKKIADNEFWLGFQSWRSVTPFAYGDPLLRSGTGSTTHQLCAYTLGKARPPPHGGNKRQDDNRSV